MTTVRSLVALVALSALTLTGCGGGSSATVLTEAEATSALLIVADLGGNFREAPADDDDDDADMGCLNDLDRLDSEAKPEVEAERDLEADTEFALPAIFSSVASFASVGDAKDALARGRKVLDTCTSVDVTDTDGSRITLEIDYNTNAADGVDEQINITASGQISVSGLELPFVFHASIFRIDNQGMILMLGTMAEDAQQDADYLIAAALTRFVPVANGDKADTPDPVEITPINPASLFSGSA